MAAFLLVHGSCHGGWYWRDLIPELAARGHAARAIDLPGHGADPTPAAQVTLDAYARAIVDALAEQDGAIVVGHSMAGYAIAAAAELAPERIGKLVYLCAYVPVSGRSLADMRRAAPRQLLAPAVRPAPDGAAFTLDPALVPGMFYHDCPAEAAYYALPRLCPQPVAPQETPLTLTPLSAGVERHYIRCAQDRVIAPEYQAAMTAGWPAARVHVLECGHSPFFAMPGVLADHLSRIAAPAPS